VTAHFRNSVPSMAESEFRASPGESRRLWVWILCCAAVAVSALLALPGGEVR
jgi:hypothetical protein